MAISSKDVSPKGKDADESKASDKGSSKADASGKDDTADAPPAGKDANVTAARNSAAHGATSPAGLPDDVDVRLDNRVGDQRPVAGEVTPQQISGDPDDDTEDPAPADPIEPGTVLGHQSPGPHGRGVTKDGD